MKKQCRYIPLILVWSIGWLQAQEVITNDEGRKIVVDANGSWQYFLPNDAPSRISKDSVFLPNAAQKNKLSIAECELKVKEISLALIKARVELVELQFAIQDGAGTTTSRQKEQLEQTQQRINILEKELSETNSRKVFLQEIAQLPEAAYEHKLKKWEAEHPSSPDSTKPTIEPNHYTYNYNASKSEIADGIIVLPPQTPCAGGTETVGKQGGQAQWETEASPFFSHTDKTIEQQFPKRDFITCKGHLTAMQGGKKYLDLEIAVASLKAPQIFGSLPKDEFLEIQLLNGETLRLFNNLPNNGQWVAAQDAFVYLGRYTFGNKEEKILRESEVDMVVVRWSLVQDKFAVYQTDFFMRQFNCLDALFAEEN